MITDVIAGSSASSVISLVSPLSPPLDHYDAESTPRKRCLSSRSPPTEYSSRPAPAKRRKLEEVNLPSGSEGQYMHPA